MTDSQTLPAPGVIEPGHVYRLDEFAQRVGLGRHALRTARRAGLPVIYASGRAYVRGDDWLVYLSKHAAAQTATG